MSVVRPQSTRLTHAPKEPKVSVLMPVWNGASCGDTVPYCVTDTLDSLLSQTFTDFEVVAVDDGSTDQTLAILQAYAEKDARVRPISVPHGGIVHALNAGLSHVRGEYIARMDADDICHPDRLALQVAYLDAHPETGLVASCVNFGGDPEASSGFMRYINWTNSLLDHQALALARFRESPIVHPSVMFRRSLVDLYGPYAEGPFPEDYELWLRYFDAGVRMHKLPQALLTWNDPPQRLTRTHDNYSHDAFAVLRARYLAKHLQQSAISQQSALSQARELYILGAGRMSRRRARHLLDHGIPITAWIDIDPNKVGNIVEGLPVLSLDQLPPPNTAMSIAFLAHHGAADELVRVLNSRGYIQGVDFILAS